MCDEAEISCTRRRVERHRSPLASLAAGRSVVVAKSRAGRALSPGGPCPGTTSTSVHPGQTDMGQKAKAGRLPRVRTLRQAQCCHGLRPEGEVNRAWRCGRRREGGRKGDDHNPASLSAALGLGEGGAGWTPQDNRLTRCSSVKCHRHLRKPIVFLFMYLRLYFKPGCSTESFQLCPRVHILRRLLSL